tara:strand:- start:266 stop:598 length:333 start_codon:yes stop_codon:yes gene_type:complete
MVEVETIKSSKDFQNAKDGQFVRSSSFLIQAIESQNDGLVKVGYTVSKQNGNAVDRNRIKRRLKSVANLVFKKHGIKNWNYVIIGKKNTLNIDFQNLTEELETAVKKIHK